MTFLCSKTSLGFPGGLLVPINGNKGNNMHRINWTGDLAFYFYLFCGCTLLQCLQRAIQMFLELSLKVRWAIWSYTDQFPLLPPTIIKVAASLAFSKFQYMKSVCFILIPECLSISVCDSVQQLHYPRMRHSDREEDARWSIFAFLNIFFKKNEMCS